MTSNDIRVNTNIIRYGVTNVSRLESVQNSRRETFAKNRRTLYYYQDPILLELNAHNMMLAKLNKSVADEWLYKYHLFKAPTGNVLSLGLIHVNEIWCVMTFRKSRNKEYFAELSRLATMPGVRVKDGYQRLSQFASELGVHNIVAYVNKSFEDVTAYESIGMQHVRDNQRKRWWLKDSQFMCDASRRQKGLSISDLESDGWFSAYDEGTAIYEYAL